MPLTAGRVSQSPELTNFALRPPEKVMRLDRMGSSFATRLSFMRSLIRRMTREGWSFDRLRFDFNSPRAVTDIELTRIENLINNWICIRNIFYVF